MEVKIIYLLIVGAIALFNYFRKLKEKQREAEKKYPVPPERVDPAATSQPKTARTPRVETLDDILKRAAEEARRQRQAKRSQPKPQPTRTWVNEKPKPVQRTVTRPFLTEDNPDYREPVMPTVTTQESIGDEGGVALVDVRKPVATAVDENDTPMIDLRKAVLYQIILERPEY